MGAVSQEPTVGPSTVGRAAYRAGRAIGHLQVLIERLPSWLVLGVLVLADWGVMAEIARISAHNGPVYYHGGDSNWYYTSAWELANGRIPYGVIGYGFPLITAPIAGIAGPSLIAGLPGMIALNLIVLAPIALMCVYGIARMLGGRLYAYLVTALWVAFPVLVIHYFLADYHSRYVDLTLPAAVGLSDRGDFPSLVVLLVASYFTLRLVVTGRDLDALAAGLAAGFAFAIKPSNLLFAPAPILALVVARRARGLGILVAATLPSLVGLVIWKQRSLGEIPAFATGRTTLVLAAVAITVAGVHLDVQKYLPLDWGDLRHNLDGFREYTWSQRLVYWTTVGGLVGLARRWSAAAVLIAAWLGAFLIGKGSYPTADFAIGGFLTHMVPAFPAYFLLLVSIPFLLPFYGRRRQLAPVASQGRLPAVAAGVLGAITLAGLVVVVALPTSATATTADVPGAYLVPLDSFKLEAKVVGAAVRLTWATAGPGGRDAVYVILRVKGRLGTGCPRIDKAKGACRLEMDIAGYVFGNRRTAVDRPPPGRWNYRIGQSMSPFRTPKTTDYILLSTAAEVRVRPRG